MMYGVTMRRLQIMIDEELDHELGRLSLQRGVSKASLIRGFVRDGLQPLAPLEEDPLAGMLGAYPGEAGDVDDVVYR